MIQTEIHKQKIYTRLYNQLLPLLSNSPSIDAQMATVNAILYHKLSYSFWAGFYFIRNKQLTVGPYQGPLACQELAYPHGACWQSIIQENPLIISDVRLFPDHIACDSRSKSEIVIPVKDKKKRIIGVFDMDSNQLDAFDSTDLEELGKILELLKF